MNKAIQDLLEQAVAYGINMQAYRGHRDGVHMLRIPGSSNARRNGIAYDVLHELGHKILGVSLGVESMHDTQFGDTIMIELHAGDVITYHSRMAA